MTTKRDVAFLSWLRGVHRQGLSLCCIAGLLLVIVALPARAGERKESATDSSAASSQRTSQADTANVADADEASGNTTSASDTGSSAKQQEDVAAASDSGPHLTDEERRFFEEKIRPILVRRCYECHGPEADEVGGELRLDYRQGLLEGGYRGPAVVPGHPEKSLLIEAVEYGDSELQMPPDSKMPEAEIALLRRWVTMGAPDPRVQPATKVSRRATIDVAQRVAEHWAWRVPQRPKLPQVAKQTWPLDRLDYFVLARLEEAGIPPAADAPRRIWLRRVTYSLRGLPPTPQEIVDFLADKRPDAYQRVVDRLLAEPSFGECWAQHWLDLVRFAETKGHEQDFEIPYAWRYRDYVIRAFNENVPYNTFVIEHIAGDLIASPRIDVATRTNQSIQGTGFWHLGEATHSPVDIRGEEADRIANQLDVFGKAFLGLALGCTRCHDHKFDALTTADFYALCGFLQSSSYRLADVSDVVAQREAFESLQDLRAASAADLAEAYVQSRVPRLSALKQALLHAADTLSRDEVTQATVEPNAANTAEQNKATDSLETPNEPSVDDATKASIAKKDKDAEAKAVPLSPHARLARELAEASRQPNHPLHVLAAVALGTRDTNSAANQPTPKDDESSSAQTAHSPTVADVVDQVIERWTQLEQTSQQSQREQMIVVTQKQGEGKTTTTRRPFDATRDIVVDFSQLDPAEWYTSGWRMSTGPAQAGTLLLGDTSSCVLERVLPRTAASGDLTSRRFTGFLRTRTFEVVGDTLWYRYRGKADVFLAVDSHRTVHGPLHGVVKQKLDSPDKVAWFGHRVADYLGHRVHVEFTPTGPFELYEVRFGSDAPPADFHTNRLLYNALVEHKPQSASEVAEAIVDAIQQALALLAAGVEGHPMARDVAELVNWVLAHDALINELSDTLPVDAQRATERFEALAAHYTTERTAIESKIPEPIFALALLDGSGEEERIHLRGNHRRLAEDPTPRRFFEALDGTAPMPIDHGSGRLELAQRLVADDNPLTARVFVNRVLHHLLGRGIVATVDDFGVMGSPPTHPKMLDDLTIDFIESGWNIKQLIRRVVLSRTYRMASRNTDEAEQADPTNRLFHRAMVRRLTAEQIRDAILAVSGRLDRKMYGPSVRVHITEFMRHNRSPDWSGPRDGNGRRSIYVEVRRNHLSHFLAAFDRPLPATTVGRRNVSNSAAQPLILLNDPFVYEQARLWAERLLALQVDDETMLETAYLTAFARRPTKVEQEYVARFQSNTASATESAQRRLQRWTEICHALLNVKEFIFLN